MKLLEFRARGVYGYLNLGVLFDRNPHILIAPNGSGKTTALRLMQALVTPALRDLLVIDFQEAFLRLSDGSGSDRVLTARKNKAVLILTISDVDAELHVPVDFLDAIEAELPNYKRLTESSRALRVKYADNQVFRAISEISMPVFLGLDRRVGLDEEYFDPSNEYRNAILRDRVSVSRFAANNLGASLSESQGLIQSAYRRVRRIQDSQASRLRKKLLLSGFEYLDFNMRDPDPNVFKFDHESITIDGLRQQRSELLTALQSVGVDSSDAEKEIYPFFEKVEALVSRLDSKKSKNDEAEAFFEAMLNRASLRRLTRLVEVVRDFNVSSKGLNQKFDNFVRCLNLFFQDSRKEASIDGLGLLHFLMPNKVQVPIQALSSGEQQLVIMFSHLFFSSFGDKSNVFVIDEPEVSLHLRWQEALLDRMVESSPRAQIIVATHSPEIVGERAENCTGVL